MSRRDLLLYLRDFSWRDVDITTAGGELGGDSTERGGGDPRAAPTLDGMADRLAGCTRCRLSQGRTQVVFGAGRADARVIFIGEGPGADEDRLGEPFVGRAGQLLNEMLRAMGVGREEVYIANIVKCRPPGNRDPEPDEAAACLPFLRRQVELVDPAVVVALGRIAARYLLGTAAPISTYRGRWMRWEGRDLLPTYHPAYLLRSPSAKAQAWADLKAVMRRLRA
jgi:uracil-DNA glycosylase family 4